MTFNAIDAIRQATLCLLNGAVDEARDIVRTNYPFAYQSANTRNYTELQKLRLFVRDGFIDRYTGKQLIFIGTLRLLSHWMPETFPYHPNWKLDACHIAYWELAPTLDHIVPITRGGSDQPDNWITTSMISNTIKAHWTIEELGLNILPPGNLTIWDGLINTFVQLVEIDSSLLNYKYFNAQYRIAKKVLVESSTK